MNRLAESLEFYIYDRLNNDPLWKDLAVIFSDAQVPGEGEHKILEYIRFQRAQEGYDANTVHCLYGADADLIMLGLSTHEVNFYVLREVFMFPSDAICSICGHHGHTVKQCMEMQRRGKVNTASSVQFQYISIWRIREFLEFEFRSVKTPFEKDFERIIDDFVFLCFFVGNDFLPHLPSMYIRQGAIDCILIIYKRLLPSLGGYLTYEGNIDYKRVDRLFEKIGVLEEALLNEKAKAEENVKQRSNPRQGLGAKITNETKYLEGRKVELDQKVAKLRGSYSERVKKEQFFAVKDQLQAEFHQTIAPAMAELRDIQDKLQTLRRQDQALRQEKAALKKQMTNKEHSNLLKKFNKDVRDMIKQMAQEEAANYTDTIRLGLEGYKNRYYAEKFHINAVDYIEFKSNIRKSYIEGLSWVLSYYYNGCPSWNWYYPYHYSPLAADLLGTKSLPSIKFDKGKPFKPFEQLMSVLPPGSLHALPDALKELMRNHKSEIADFYPKNFRLDINGQRFSWMGVNLLPFIEENRLLKALNKYEVNLQ